MKLMVWLLLMLNLGLLLAFNAERWLLTVRQSVEADSRDEPFAGSEPSQAVSLLESTPKVEEARWVGTAAATVDALLADADADADAQQPESRLVPNSVASLDPALPDPQALDQQLRLVQQRLAAPSATPRVQASPQEITPVSATDWQGRCVKLEADPEPLARVVTHWQSRGWQARDVSNTQVISQLHWVLEQAATNRDQRQETMQSLLARGFDASPVSGFDNPYAVSMGMFSNIDNAQGLHQRALTAGYDAILVARDRTIVQNAVLVTEANWRQERSWVVATYPQIKSSVSACN